MRSKINHLNANGTWVTPAPDEKTLYKFEIGFEDGNAGEMYSATASNGVASLPIKIGDEVEYDYDTTKKTPKVKITKYGEDLDKPTPLTAREKTELSIIAQSSIKTAAEYCASKGLTSSDGELFSLADEIFAWVQKKSEG